MENSRKTSGVSSFECFDDTGYCHPELFKVSLRNAELFVSLDKIQEPTCWPYAFCRSKIYVENLHNIISSSIHKITGDGGKYQLFLGSDEGGHGFIKIRSLEFTIRSEGVFYTFEAENMMNFLKWVSAIQVRHSTK